MSHFIFTAETLRRRKIPASRRLRGKPLNPSLKYNKPHRKSVIKTAKVDPSCHTWPMGILLLSQSYI
jgi:hypothetical protein